MEQQGQLVAILQERTLKQARQGGMNMFEAQEIAFPMILLPGETEQDIDWES